MGLRSDFSWTTNRRSVMLSDLLFSEGAATGRPAQQSCRAGPPVYLGWNRFQPMFPGGLLRQLHKAGSACIRFMSKAPSSELATCTVLYCNTRLLLSLCISVCLYGFLSWDLPENFCNVEPRLQPPPPSPPSTSFLLHG
jgi:hypothetical protein